MPNSSPPPGGAPESAAEELETKGLRAIWCPDLGFARVDPEVREIAEAAATPLIDGERVEAALTVPFTMLANFCWNPAISIPAGVTRAGLPVGLQVTVRRHRDEHALRLARISEQANPWPLTAPGWF